MVAYEKAVIETTRQVDPGIGPAQARTDGGWLSKIEWRATD
jgi:hypothetical protein